MELSENVKRRLSLISKIKLSNPEFLELITSAFNSICDSRTSIPDVSAWAKLDNTSQRELHAALVILFTEAAKFGLDESSLSQILEECSFTAEQSKTFCTFFAEHKGKLVDLLSQVNTTFPQIIDADWRLDYHIKDSNVDRVRQPVFLIDLKTKATNGPSTSDVQFSCTHEQLQDLVTKLKDACKSAERVASQSAAR